MSNASGFDFTAQSADGENPPRPGNGKSNDESPGISETSGTSIAGWRNEQPASGENVSR